MQPGKSVIGYAVGLALTGLTAFAAPRPNFVFILADDLRYADVGFHGCQDIPTPNLDRLAASGMRFTSGYAGHPFCSPTRASLMTGRYQHRFGWENNIAYDPQNTLMGLPASGKTIAERLKRLGYRTGMVGKWHLGAAHPFHPNQRGFDEFHGFLGGGHNYFEVNLHRPMGEGYYTPIDHNGQPRGLDGYLTTDLTDAAVGFIRRQGQKPFFLYVAYNAPHTPLQAPADRLARLAHIQERKRRTYAAMVSVMDDGVGRILAALEARGLRENTLVCFLSDNGGPTNVNASSNRPLRGTKGTVYEGGIRVPFVMSWPGRLLAGGTYHHPVIASDLTVTALSLAGEKPDELAQLDGVDLLPLLKGTQGGSPHPFLCWRMGGGKAWAIRAGSWKLLQSGANRPAELYDLDQDLAETRDLASERPEIVARLRHLYEQWNAGNLDPFFPGYRDYHTAKQAFYRSLIQPPGTAPSSRPSH